MEKSRLLGALAVATPMAFIGDFAGKWWALSVFVVVFILLDYITGIIAGRANGGLSSDKARRGVYTKMGLISLLALGVFLDESVNFFVKNDLNFNFGLQIPLGAICGAWIIVTESISICENLEKLGVIIPKFVLNLLRKAESNIDKEN